MDSLIQASEVVNGGIVRPVALNARFDSQLVSPFLGIAEYRFLLPIICKDMFDDMLSKKNATASNYNPNVGALVQAFPADPLYEVLWVQFIMHLSSWSVMFLALPTIAIQTGSGGLFMNDSQFAESAGEKGAKYLQDSILNNSIKTLQQALEDYLCNNYADYPLFPKDSKCKDCAGCGCGESECKGLTTCTKTKRVVKNTGIIIY